MNKKRKKRIKEIVEVARKIKGAVSTDYFIKEDKEEFKRLEKQGLKNMNYMPTVFEIAKYYGIRYEFKEIEGNEPAFLERKNMIIYISNKYREDGYATEHILAHELGHFFLHKKSVSEMNIFPRRTSEEYEANVFSILIMPQIARGEAWETWSPKKIK